jgi:hypothetical protein
MTDIQKQILYNKYLHGDLKLEDILPGDLKRLTVAWFDHKMKMMPLEKDYTLFVAELRRREIEAASKPMKPIDRSFYE